MLEISEEDLKAIQQAVVASTLYELEYTYLPLYDDYCAKYGNTMPFGDFLDGSYALDEDAFAIMEDAIQYVMGVDVDTAEEALLETDLEERISAGIDFDKLVNEVANK